jgi:hypothetical protein
LISSIIAAASTSSLLLLLFKDGDEDDDEKDVADDEEEVEIEDEVEVEEFVEGEVVRGENEDGGVGNLGDEAEVEEDGSKGTVWLRLVLRSRSQQISGGFLAKDGMRIHAT